MAVSPRRYYAFFKFDGEQSSLFEQRMTDALNYLQREGEARCEAGVYSNDFGRLLELGIVYTESGMGANKEDERGGIIAKELARLKKIRAEREALIQIYEERGLDEFVTWCNQGGIGWEEWLAEYATGLFSQEKERPWANKAREWLEEFLGDGRPHHIDEVKKEAVMEGVIDDTDDGTIDRDWHKLKVVASRAGYSGRGSRGFWEE